MDLLLTHGFRLADHPDEEHPYPPLGLLYLASHLERAGFDVEVLDSTFTSRQAYRQRLAEARPPVVGIYANLLTRGEVVTMARLAREQGAHVVLGGPEPAAYAEEYLARGADAVVHGEGELTLEELVPHLIERGARDLEGIAGLSWLDGEGRAVENAPRALIPDLDGQPFPARRAIDLERYLDAWRRQRGFTSVSLITARGCPYRCSWCSHGVFGFTHRRRSPANVADEVEEIVAAWAPDALWYADDVFTIHPRWLSDYAAELDRRGLSLPFETISREDRLDEETIDLLAAMGCRRLWVGAESGSQRILDAMQRRTDAARMREMVRLLQDRGIEAGTFVMLGYEGESEEDLRATVDHLVAAPPDAMTTTVAYPIKGTAYHAEVEERLVHPGDWEATTDRDLVVRGRPSPAYYRGAIRWLTAEVERARARRRGARLAGARAAASSWAGRLQMTVAGRPS